MLTAVLYAGEQAVDIDVPSHITLQLILHQKIPSIRLAEHERQEQDAQCNRRYVMYVRPDHCVLKAGLVSMLQSDTRRGTKITTPASSTGAELICILCPKGLGSSRIPLTGTEIKAPKHVNIPAAKHT